MAVALFILGCNFGHIRIATRRIFILWALFCLFVQLRFIYWIYCKLPVPLNTLTEIYLLLLYKHKGILGMVHP